MDFTPYLKRGGNPGDLVNIPGGLRLRYCYWDGSAPGSLVKGQPVQLTWGTIGSTSLVGPKIKVVAGSATVPCRLLVAQETLTAAGWSWFIDKGPVDYALVTGHNSISAAGKVLCVLTTAAVFTYEGTSWAITSGAISGEAMLSGATYGKIFLPGEPIMVAA